ncbi:MAG TPA: DUF6114 domain-containing protein, partial [Rugosimonospora sp.]|nr:DUF6114 domain-containing protein [Rugosimonospora sp.]
MRDRLDRFRLWRRARPFWGGLLTIVSGFEYALSAHLDLTPIKVQLGPQGFLTWVIPLMLIMAGALIWVTPAQRVFYGVVAVAVAVYGLIGVNLGGFLAGMVLGIVGGALAASWGQVTAAEPQTSTMDPETAELPLVRDDPPAGGGSTARHAALAV